MHLVGFASFLITDGGGKLGICFHWENLCDLGQKYRIRFLLQIILPQPSS